MELWELQARETIRDLVARYNANGDAGRFDPMLALFVEDAVLEVPERVIEGRGAIRAYFEEVARGDGDRKPVRLLRHHTATLQIDVASRHEARSRCYYQVFTEAGLDHWGRYLDDYRHPEDRWLFSRRQVRLDGATPNSWAATLL
jgi:3-phenylpropionate/cinnamic acid dioxygenase small subunit